MATKTYYELLELPPTASADEIKRAFRHHISRYHPDKVHHLGEEFQEMAALRSAELTEAYRVLSDEGRRAEYDRAAFGSIGPADVESDGGAATDVVEEPSSAAPPPFADSGFFEPASFTDERATRDEFVRKATLARLRQAFAALGEDYAESHARGFDLLWMPKSKLFGAGARPRVLVRFVPSVDARAVTEAWWHAAKWACGEEVSVLLIGPTVATPNELARSIAEQRTKTRGTNVGLIPVNANTWNAYLPTDAPVVCKTLLTRLQSAT